MPRQRPGGSGRAGDVQPHGHGRGDGLADGDVVARVGSTFAPGATQVTVTATDAAGNTAQCTFQVRVQAEVVEIAGGGCDSTGGTTSALALLAALAAWSHSRRRQNPAGEN
ncbi:HYR domain-containing protein [Corallococcus sp. 4LFB]|uniref:HYR domain-containing protein n=1 Tax=Corallococcus sp. 4LFB TaxID=3383249 RepID=UPI00397563AD